MFDKAKNAASIFINRFNKNIPEVESIACRGINNTFASVYTNAVYKKILLECAERAVIPNEIDHSGFSLSVYDSYSPKKNGLITIILDCLVNNNRVFFEALKISGVNDGYIFTRIEESKAFKNDKIKPNIIELDFSLFEESRLVYLLFECLGFVLTALDKNITVANALIYKLHALSEQISHASSIEPIISQIKSLNDGIREGKGGYIDALSSIETIEIKTASAQQATDLIYGLIATIVGLPKSDLFGEVTTGLGNGDNGDERREHLAHRRYFHDILAGVLYSVWGRPFSYKTPPADLTSLIDAAAFIETTTLLTRNGKLKILKNHFRGLSDDDFNIPLAVK